MTYYTAAGSAVTSYPSHFDVPKEDRSVMVVPQISNANHTHSDLGIGVVLEVARNGSVMVGGIVPGGPADLEGVKCGDVFLQVDGVSCMGKSAEQVSKRLAGPPGEPVVVRLGLRPFDFGAPMSSDSIRTVSIRRGNDSYSSVADGQTSSISQLAQERGGTYVNTAPAYVAIENGRASMASVQ